MVRDINVRKGTQGFVETVKDAPSPTGLGASDIGDDPAEASLAHIREILPDLRTYAEYSVKARRDIEVASFAHGLHNAGLHEVVLDRAPVADPEHGPRKLWIKSVGHKVGVVHIGRNGKPLTELPAVDWNDMEDSLKAETSGATKTMLLDEIAESHEPLVIPAYKMSDDEFAAHERIVGNAQRQSAKVHRAETALIADELHKRGVVAARFSLRRTDAYGDMAVYYDLNEGSAATVYETPDTPRLTSREFNALAHANFSRLSQIEMSSRSRDGDIWSQHSISATERTNIVKAD